ncbi:hypothetical protein [Pyrobaculum neutrophilum]|uniref:Uncharacterized protein n=1 Tax=Pyrobaculum neutrophilum (strain DSM 2338 / JCM 9278 / NBRC 100436 / V24Sta) TaxID=444157 RepID=B1Y9S1_PYRNV|nr:hypothetical protein [Pyrobaculum neutrophilum]ACB40471.1 hypothetical protein Tneu_1547 [Pyrobaculum neutrophilum V24Sta]
MKIYVRKIDDTLVPEFVEVKPNKLSKVRLSDLYIILEEDFNLLEKAEDVRHLLGDL